jgi:signal peptidase II
VTAERDTPQASRSRALKSRILFWALFGSMLIADQWLKHYIRGAFHQRQREPIVPNVLDLTLTYNEGIAFGLFQGAGIFLAPIAVLIAIIAAVYSHRNPRDSMWMHGAMALLAAGALGNLYDRLAHGRVTDMFEIRLFQFPVFNIADACITVAAGILIVKWGREAFLPETPDTSAQRASSEAAPPEPPARPSEHREPGS